jgi:uncharacterized protein
MTIEPSSDNTIRVTIANRHEPVPEETIQDFCRRWKLTAFRFYGSITRDDFRPDSDIDVMVEFEPDAKTSFSDLIDMQEELESLLGRKVDLTDRYTVERSENYIRRKGILSGKPPVLRQMSYLLDMLISCLAIVKIVSNDPPESIDSDNRLFHAISYNAGWLVVSAGRVDEATRQLVPEIPWGFFDTTHRIFEADPFDRDKKILKKIAWEIVPGVIPLMSAVIPPEREV